MSNDQASQFASTTMQIAADAVSRKKAFKRSKELMKEQRDWDKKMWDHQNAYNTPLEQMKRYKEAGLNPALMYGQGNPGNANNTVQSKFTELEPYMTGDTIGKGIQTGIQVSLLNQQKKLLKAQEFKTDSGAMKDISGSGVDKITEKRMRDMLPGELKGQTQTNKNLEATYDQIIGNTAQLSSLEKLNNQLFNHQEKTGTVKGDTIGSLMRVFGINLNSEQGRTAARNKIYTLLAYDTFRSIAPTLINNMTGLLKQFIGNKKVNKELQSTLGKIFPDATKKELQKMINQKNWNVQ